VTHPPLRTVNNERKVCKLLGQMELDIEIRID